MNTADTYIRAPELVLKWDESGSLVVKKFARAGEYSIKEDAAIAFELLHRFSAASTLSQVLDRCALQVSQQKATEVFAQLLDNQFLVAPVEPKGDQYFSLYSGLEVHRDMVLDHPRTSSFKEAIEKTVKPGDIVLDVGCGTGVLSCFAAQAGASRVYAVDNSEIIKIAREIARTNGLDDRITFIHGDIEQVEVPEKVDLLVSEWLGHFVVIENMLEAVLTARNKFLKPKGLMLPRSVEMFAVPMADEFLHNSLIGVWTRDLYGLDFTPMRQAAMRQSESRCISASNLLADPRPIHQFQMSTAQPGTMAFTGSTEFSVERDAQMDGFGCHFTIDLTDGVLLDTGPYAAATHWLQHYLPIEPVAVKRKDTVQLQVVSRPSDFPRRPEIEITYSIVRGREVKVEGQRLVYL